MFKRATGYYFPLPKMVEKNGGNHRESNICFRLAAPHIRKLDRDVVFREKQKITRKYRNIATYINENIAVVYLSAF
jgi:hypothetical protein